MIEIRDSHDFTRRTSSKVEPVAPAAQETGYGHNSQRPPIVRRRLPQPSSALQREVQRTCLLSIEKLDVAYRTDSGAPTVMTLHFSFPLSSIPFSTSTFTQ